MSKLPEECRAPGGPAAAMTVGDIRALIGENALFAGMSDAQMEALLALVREVRTVRQGEVLVTEGEVGDEIFLIRSGRFEVIKKEAAGPNAYRLADLEAGQAVGEVVLLDAGPRSATVRALTEAEVLVLGIDALNATAARDESVAVRLKMNLALEMGQKLRSANEATVRHLRERLAEAEMRAEMGKFLTRVLVGLALYMFTMGLAGALAKVVPDTSLVNVPILTAFAYGVYRTVRTSPYPLAQYGLTLENWRWNVLDALAWTIPMLGAVVALKWLLVTYVPALQGRELFDLARSTGLTPLQVLVFSLAYAAFVPIQEMIARSGIQSSCQIFLSGRYRTLEAILLSNLLFSATHLHVSLQMALFVFPAGVFWGWLFWRQGSIVGTSVSHTVVGLFAFFFVGFDFVY